MPGPWDRFTWRWFSQSCFTGRRRGSWHPKLGGFWVESTAGWPAGWRGDNLIEDGTLDGYIPWWRILWWRRYCRRWRPTYPAARTKSYSLLRPGPLWTCVWRRRGGRVQGWLIGGGSSMYWMWRGWRRQLGRQRRRTEWRRRWIKLVGG